MLRALGCEYILGGVTMPFEQESGIWTVVRGKARERRGAARACFIWLVASPASERYVCPRTLGI